MATLTDAAIVSRKIFKVFVIFFSFFLAIVIFLTFGKSIRDQIFPPAAPPPTVAFGKLPKMDLSGGYKSPPATTYTVETITGELPALQQVAKVFEIEPEKVQFGDLERAKRSAERAGFTGEPQQIAPSRVRFTDPQNAQRTLTIETSTGNVELESNWENNLRILTERITNEQDAQDKASDFFLSFGLSRQEFPSKNLKLTKYRVDAGKLTEVQALSQANIIKVAFKRTDLDKLPIIPQKKDEDAIFALVSNREVVAASLTNIKIRRFKFATYPLKGVTKAFEDLRTQKAAFNSEDFLSTSQNNLVIRNVSIGYIESNNKQPYFQPAYLFIGDNFIAYVPAVSDAWIAGEQP